jgi:hypothetical protein
MCEFGDDLNSLAKRARQGESEAVGKLQSALQPQLRRIVRRTLRTGADDTPLGRRILAEAGSARTMLDSERQVGHLAKRVCRSLAERLAAPAPVHQLMRDTVLA